MYKNKVCCPCRIGEQPFTVAGSVFVERVVRIVNRKIPCLDVLKIINNIFNLYIQRQGLWYMFAEGNTGIPLLQILILKVPYYLGYIIHPYKIALVTKLFPPLVGTGKTSNINFIHTYN